jgi:hemerythrin superfamily protein
MDDIYEYLKNDHKKVSELFALFEKTQDPNVKVQIVAMIVKELLLHAETEQATFYKTLEEYELSKDAAEHGEKEHKEIEDQINELTKFKDPTKVWENKVIKLKDLVAHHVKEEEGVIFNNAKKVLSEEQAYELKEKMHYMKGQILEMIQ